MIRSVLVFLSLLQRHHPGGIAAAVSESAEPVISSTEPLALEEDVTPESPLQAKIAGIVSTVLQEFNEGAVKPDSASTCVGEDLSVHFFVMDARGW